MLADSPVRLGRQEPTFQAVGPYAYSAGDEAVELFGGYGVSFYPSQEYELTLFLARDGNGRVAARTIGISKPRQNGKSFAARYYAVWMAAIEGKKVFYTAHHGKTVRKMFKAIVEFVEGHSDFRETLKPGKAGIYRAAGSEGVYFANGGMIEFATRTNSGGRGETYDVIIVDEAQELTDEQRDALKPTTIASESGDPQMIYIGTPPNEKCPGTVFRDLHDKAHDGMLGHSWWLEWAAAEVGDTLDKDRWYETNPALGYRIQEDVFADAADTVAPDSFAREYLGWWSKTVAASPALEKADWDACATDSPPKTGGIVAFSVKFSPDGGFGVLAACRRPERGDPYVEVVARRSAQRGTAWFAKWLLERKDVAAQVTIDGQAKAAALEKRLLRDGMPKKAVRKAQTADVIAACSMLGDAVEARQVAHSAQPALDRAVERCPKRKIGTSGGWGFETAGTAEAELPEAVALAYWGAMTTKRRPGKKARVL